MIASLMNLAGPEMVILLPLTVFFLWMFVDCIRFEPEKVKWILVLLIVPLGSVAYYFDRKRKRVVPPPLPPQKTL